ncbi:MAG TPA: HIT domain-containing protein [Pyrinomonadaceae bacterium]|nr:HIT domain-containing protein [Pyrinomonadaceae bacterium]
MDRLWSPWRYDYINSGSSVEKSKPVACVFCSMLEAEGTDESKYILHRAQHNFVVLNIYPYISGHLMIVPYAHLSEIAAAPKEITDEMMDLTKRAQSVLGEVYHPNGFNIGMNLGRAAGAGVADHFHMHIMPRWIGDTNFMTTVGETRVHPEDLATTYKKLYGKF